MAGSVGCGSNSQGALRDAWNGEEKAASISSSDTLDLLELEELFTTLAEWNEYLEHSVPYYAENPVEGGPN